MSDEGEANSYDLAFFSNILDSGGMYFEGLLDASSMLYAALNNGYHTTIN
jgi:hypothetical protein